MFDVSLEVAEFASRFPRKYASGPGIEEDGMVASANSTPRLNPASMPAGPPGGHQGNAAVIAYVQVSCHLTCLTCNTCSEAQFSDAT